MGKSDMQRAKIIATRQKAAEAAARRQAARSAALLEEQMREIAKRLAKTEQHRVALLAARDQLVVRARADGYSWPAIARMAGTSHQALLKRVPREG